MCFFRKKIKARNFFNYNKKKLDIKGIKSSLASQKTPIEISLGELSTENFPTQVSETLQQLDLLQNTIANAINSLNEGEEKELKKKEYIDTLLKMFEIAQNKEKEHKPDDPISESEKKKIMSYDAILYDFFTNSDFEIANITKSELNTPGLIIWPVALQDRPTIIHKAQIETIKVLQSHLWTLKIIIADCGTSDPQRKISHFKSELEKHLANRSVKADTITLLSDHYNKADADGGSILKKFTEISNNLKIVDLKEYNTKNDSYSHENKQKVENRVTLKFIEPILTWSVVIHEAEQYCDKNKGKKSIVIAGQDESKQWKYIFGFSSNIGGIFNLILKDEGENTIFQEEKPMIFHSENEVVENLDKGNLARWLFEVFISIPNYPVELKNLSFCNECKKYPTCRHCLFLNGSNGKLPDHVDRRKYVTSFWEIINPNKTIKIN